MSEATPEDAPRTGMAARTHGVDTQSERITPQGLNGRSRNGRNDLLATVLVMQALRVSDEEGLSKLCTDARTQIAQALPQPTAREQDGMQAMEELFVLFKECHGGKAYSKPHLPGIQRAVCRAAELSVELLIRTEREVFDEKDASASPKEQEIRKIMDDAVKEKNPWMALEIAKQKSTEVAELLRASRKGTGLTGEAQARILRLGRARQQVMHMAKAGNALLEHIEAQISAAAEVKR